MLAIPTTLITVKRDQTSQPDEDFMDSYEDGTGQADNFNVVASNVPASLLEQAPVVINVDTGEPNTIRYFVGRIDSRVDIRPQDQVIDANGLEYDVDFVSKQQSFAFTPDLKMHLRLRNVAS